MDSDTHNREADQSGTLKLAAAARELRADELRGLAPLTALELEQARGGSNHDPMLGQQRATAAVSLAISIDAPGYNVFISGLRGREEREPIIKLLREKAAAKATPGDWIYVNNFRSPEAPLAISLPTGKGRELREQMRDLVRYIREQLPKAFSQEDFSQERASLKDKYNRRAQELFGKLESHAKERGFTIQSAPNGQPLFIPLIAGKPAESPEELAREMGKLSEDERSRLAKGQSDLQEELATLLMRQQEMMRELMQDIRRIERAFAARLIRPPLENIKQYFNAGPVSDYLDQVTEHLLEHLDRFHEAQGDGRPVVDNPPMLSGGDSAGGLHEYEVNLIVDNSGQQGTPVVVEDAPNYRNLFGTIERWTDPLGRVATNFTRIVGGSYHRADRGFLVLDLDDAVIEPGVWHALKRSLKTGRVTVETFEPFPFFQSGLKPEPIEICPKLVVLGSPLLYNMLYFYDQDFAELFKIKADIRPVMDADTEAVRHYATRIASLSEREKLPPFDGGALARIVEFGMRAAGDRSRVLTRMEPIDDLARESAYFARLEHATEVTARHVERAISERILRLNFIEEEIRRMIADGTLIVELEGSVVGQVNGLAVLDVGGYAFGRPSRVTASVSLGQAGLINIEREARLSGSTHDKGIMILTSYLRGRFGQEHPLAMTASICFEQSYSGIDGDSASSTELYALLSALSGVPIRQDFAVTGSVDQYGRVQAIGGVNEKIESFYRVCKAVGLSGRQGVLIPQTNIKNLMLEAEVVAAVAQGKFHIHPIDSIDRGIELLTGVRAGAIDEPGTINYLVDARLRTMAEKIRGLNSHETRIVHESPNAPAPRPPEPPSPRARRPRG